MTSFLFITHSFKEYIPSWPCSSAEGGGQESYRFRGGFELVRRVFAIGVGEKPLQPWRVMPQMVGNISRRRRGMTESVRIQVPDRVKFCSDCRTKWLGVGFCTSVLLPVALEEVTVVSELESAAEKSWMVRTRIWSPASDSVVIFNPSCRRAGHPRSIRNWNR